MYVAAGHQQLWAIAQSLWGSQASNATWNCANSNEGLNFIKYNLTNSYFDYVESGERISLVITENSFAPSVLGLWCFCCY